MAKPRYGQRHRLERERWRGAVELGQVACARCGRMIVPGTRWHLDHTEDGSGWLGPSHAHCNLLVAARKGGNFAPAAVAAPPGCGDGGA